MTNQELNEVLNKFPDNATSWRQADDRIMLLTRLVRCAYNEHVLDVVEGDEGYVASLDYRSFKTPAKWNQESKKMIRKYWGHIPAYAKKDIRGYFYENGKCLVK